jgi:SAM-dependent methyltransferase
MLHAEEETSVSKKEKLIAGFEDTIISMVKSRVFGRYCSEVYGYPIKLLSMVSSEDIEELIEYVKYKRPYRTLELGCGTGELLGLLAQQSDGLFFGLENSRKVVRYLNDHNQIQNLKFILGDIDAFVDHRQKYDLILVIDSLYFVDDLDTSVSNILSSLAPEGTAIIYYSEYRGSTENDMWKNANENKVGRILEKYSAKYEFAEITERELACWQNILIFGNIYKSEFEKEGNLISIDGNIAEAESISDIIKTSGGKRFKYSIRRGGRPR